MVGGRGDEEQEAISSWQGAQTVQSWREEAGVLWRGVAFIRAESTRSRPVQCAVGQQPAASCEQEGDAMR
jgi:hypothetical protein